MAGIKDIPFDAARQVAEGMRSASAARRSCVRIAIEVDEGAPSTLVCAIRDAFVRHRSREPRLQRRHRRLGDLRSRPRRGRCLLLCRGSRRHRG